MSILQILIISIVQGITEWLPVSSSAHVLLAASYFGYEGRDELLINAIANFGTVASMLIYFRKEIGEAIVGVFALPGALGAKRELSPGERLAMNLLASLPLTMLGLAIARLYIPDSVNEAVRSVQGVAIPLIGFGILLGLADIYGAKTRTINEMPPWHAVLIGAVQVIGGLHRPHAPSRLGRAHRAGVQIGQHDPLRTFVEKRTRHRAADPTAAAGDQGDFVL